MLDKTYDSASVDPRIAKKWDEENAFRAGAGAKPGADSFCIVIPPPNVTGSLHMGHALNNTLQDVLIRWKRMQGFNALWMPGTDHAGIATQSVVERLVFQQEKKTRHDLGRDELVKRIWAWKDKYEERILGQLREIGLVQRRQYHRRDTEPPGRKHLLADAANRQDQPAQSDLTGHRHVLTNRFLARRRQDRRCHRHAG